jgi:hypothetical protein
MPGVDPLRDAPLITALIIDRPLCVRCIAQKTALTEEATLAALEIIGRAIAIKRGDVATCQGCGSVAPVFSVARPE